MNVVRNIEYFESLLKADPALRCPQLPHPCKTFEVLQEWKSATRCYDRARINLGIVTVAQVQDENSAIKREDRDKLKIVWERSFHAPKSQRIYA
jgi:hypothetical protein